MITLSSLLTFSCSAAGFDETINNAIAPLSSAISNFIFFEITILGSALPLIVLWLIGAAIFFTFYFNFISLKGFKHAFQLLRGDFSKPNAKGELTHFQALSTAVSGTVGIGNIAGVAIVISIGGPGATFG